MNCPHCQHKLTDQIIHSHTFCPACESMLKIVDGVISPGAFESVAQNQLMDIAILGAKILSHKSPFKKTPTKIQCPSCHLVSSHLIGSGQPIKGSISLCQNCTAFLRFTDKLDLELLPSGAFAELPFNVRQALNQARKKLTQ